MPPCRTSWHFDLAGAWDDLDDPDAAARDGGRTRDPGVTPAEQLLRARIACATRSARSPRPLGPFGSPPPSGTSTRPCPVSTAGPTGGVTHGSDLHRPRRPGDARRCASCSPSRPPTGAEFDTVRRLHDDLTTTLAEATRLVWTGALGRTARRARTRRDPGRPRDAQGRSRCIPRLAVPSDLQSPAQRWSGRPTELTADLTAHEAWKVLTAETFLARSCLDQLGTADDHPDTGRRAQPCGRSRPRPSPRPPRTWPAAGGPPRRTRSRRGRGSSPELRSPSSDEIAQTGTGPERADHPTRDRGPPAPRGAARQRGQRCRASAGQPRPAHRHRKAPRPRTLRHDDHARHDGRHLGGVAGNSRPIAPACAIPKC